MFHLNPWQTSLYERSDCPVSGGRQFRIETPLDASPHRVGHCPSGTRPPRSQATGAWTGTSCKPSSVRGGRGPTRGDHVSGAAVADGLLHATRLDPRITGATASRRSRLLALARGGVCRAPSVTGTGGALLPHRFTLACDRSHIGGLFSVALSLTRSPRAGGCYPPPSSCRARTFLTVAHAKVRPPARRHDSSR